MQTLYIKELHGIWLNMKSLTLLTACIDPVWICNACNCEDICREKETSWNNGEFIHFHTSVCELHEFRAVRCLGLYEMDATFTPSFQREPHGDALHAVLEDNIWMSVDGLWCKHQQYDIQHWTSSHYETSPLTNCTNNSPRGEPILEHGCEENPKYSDVLHPCWIFPLDLWISLKRKTNPQRTSLFSHQYRIYWQMSRCIDNYSCPTCLLFFRVSIWTDIP